jgi:hypothetical protein
MIRINEAGNSVNSYELVIFVLPPGAPLLTRIPRDVGLNRSRNPGSTSEVFRHRKYFIVFSEDYTEVLSLTAAQFRNT